MDGKPSQSTELFQQLLEELNRAVCQSDAPVGQEVDAETLQLSLQVLWSLVEQPVRRSVVLRVLGQGTQGLVQSVELEDGQLLARKVMILTAAQAKEGSVLVGLQDIVWAARCCLGLGASKLRKHLPSCCALHIWGTQDICKDMISLGFSNQGSTAGSTGVVSGPGVVVVMDMEQMSCNLTHFSKRCHVPGGDVAYASTLPAEIQDKLRGTPLGSRWVDVRQWLHITKQVLVSLKQLHASRLIHCDLKPDNILLKLDDSVDMPCHALFSLITSVKLADLGAACVLDAHGCTEDAKLCTVAYLHPEKKCIRYEEEHAHHSSVQFDLVEVCAALLEACLGLCPAKQLRGWLLCEPLHQLVFGEISYGQAKGRDAKARDHWKALQSIQQQGVAGQAFYALIQLFLHAWSTAGRVAIDAMLSEIQRLQNMCGVTGSRSTSTDGAAAESRVSFSSGDVATCTTADVGHGILKYGVLLDGLLLPPTEATLDDLFSKLTSSQVQALCEVHPDTYNHWCAYEDRKAKQQQQPTPLAHQAPSPVHESGSLPQDSSHTQPAAQNSTALVNTNSSPERRTEALSSVAACEHRAETDGEQLVARISLLQPFGVEHSHPAQVTQCVHLSPASTYRLVLDVEEYKEPASLMPTKCSSDNCHDDGDMIKTQPNAAPSMQRVEGDEAGGNQNSEYQHSQVGRQAVSSSGTMCHTPMSGSHGSLIGLLAHTSPVSLGSLEEQAEYERSKLQLLHGVHSSPLRSPGSNISVSRENHVVKNGPGELHIVQRADHHHVCVDCTGRTQPAHESSKRRLKFLHVAAVAAAAVVAGVGITHRSRRRAQHKTQ